MSENSGTDARFPYEHRQNVVVRLCMFLLLEQERLFDIAALRPSVSRVEARPEASARLALIRLARGRNGANPMLRLIVAQPRAAGSIIAQYRSIVR